LGFLGTWDLGFLRSRSENLGIWDPGTQDLVILEVQIRPKRRGIFRVVWRCILVPELMYILYYSNSSIILYIVIYYILLYGVYLYYYI